MKQALRTWLGNSRARARYTIEPVRRRAYGTLGEAELRAALAQAGVVSGATVMAHVSMNEIQRAAPAIDPLGVIRLLEDALTPAGTLLLLTSPFIGFQVDYIATRPSFDVRRTPSRMGLVTELFRRMPDTVRSLHPTHPVAGWGAHAQELLNAHHLGETFGQSSPFCRMRERDGIVIGIGADLQNGFTILHSVEYLHPEAREFAFASEPSTLPIKNGDSTFDCSFRALRKGLNRRDRKIESELRATKTLTYKRYAGLMIASARAEAFIDRGCQIISNGSFYGSGPLSR